jgi:predicted ATPase
MSFGLLGRRAVCEPRSNQRWRDGCSAIVSALRLRQERDRPPLETLLHRLAKRHLLLVLDNCEHLLSRCATEADALLRACPDLRILATSREPLGVAGESVWAVLTLTIVDRRRAVSADALLASEAGRLFVERATSAQSSFALRADNVQAVTEICWQLDGIPLAIELAAVRVRGLTVAQIASRLGDQLRLLSSGSRASPPRHQTLRATIDWSYRPIVGWRTRVVQPAVNICWGLDAPGRRGLSQTPLKRCECNCADR